MARGRDSRGRFLKRGGGHRRRRSQSTAIVHVPRTVTRYRTRTIARRSRRRSSGFGGGIKLTHAVGVGALIGYASGQTQYLNVLDKIPGTKTIGRPAMLGLAALAVNRYLYRNRWLKLIGVGGLLAGAFEWGKAGLKLEWMGDAIDVDD